MDMGAIWAAIQPEMISIVICVVGGLTAYLYQWGLQRLPEAMRAHIADLADMAVRDIEQKYSAGSPGKEIKKQEAMQLLLSLCQSLRLPLDVMHASAAIEAAVFTLGLIQQQAPAPDKPTVPMPSVPTNASKTLAAG